MTGVNWRLVIPAAGAAGFLLLGVWGLMLAPLGAVAYFALQRRREEERSGIREEEKRLAEFVALPAAQPAPPADTRIPPRKPSFEEMRERAASLDGRSKFNAYAEARLALLENARDVHAAVECALLSRRIEDAGRAIGACVDAGQGAMAASVFAEFVEQRTTLPLAPRHWEALGRVLLGRGAYLEAAWTMHAGALLAKDPMAAQKRLIEVAAKAADAGQPQVALKLYETLLAKYPASQYAEFVRANMKLEQRKVVKA